MTRRATLLALALGVVLAGLQQPTAALAEDADPGAGITADVDGAPIPATEAGTYFCHDFEFPHLSCFSSGAELEEALADQVAIGGATALASFAAGDYLTVYSAASYGGSYAHLSQNYDGLWVIGWNDRISSFKVRNSARGSFHADWYAGGARLDFCCNSATPYLSSTFNKTISSVYRA